MGGGGEEVIRGYVALSIALKDLVRLRLEAGQTAIKAYEDKYGMPFIEFKEAWEAGRISTRYSYEVEGTIGPGKMLTARYKRFEN